MLHWVCAGEDSLQRHRGFRPAAHESGTSHRSNSFLTRQAPSAIVSWLSIHHAIRPASLMMATL